MAGVTRAESGDPDTNIGVDRLDGAATGHALGIGRARAACL